MKILRVKDCDECKYLEQDLHYKPVCELSVDRIVEAPDGEGDFIPEWCELEDAPEDLSWGWFPDL